jgi:nitric oxide synthase-interacting protein
MRLVDSCVLCLQTARNPVICQEGHLFCKECVLENIVSQRKEISREKTIVENNNNKVSTPQEIAEKEQQEKRIQEFVKQESSISCQLETQEKQVINSAAFWMPKYKETVQEAKLSKEQPQCPIGKPHVLSVKKINQVLFNKINTDICCFVCQKSFNLGIKVVVLKKCGHSFCKHCSDKFVLKENKCAVCNSVHKPKDLVTLDCDGTGFSGGGKAEAVKETLAFQ